MPSAGKTVFTASDTAQMLFQFAEGLAGPYGHEFSVKLSAAGVSRQRFLITFPAVALTMGADLQGLLAELSFPLLADLPEFLAGGDMLHLALEEAHSGRVLLKFYVEDAARARSLWERSDAATTEPVLVHRAWKWCPEAGGAAEARYHWLPCRTYPQLLAEIQRQLPDFGQLLTALVHNLQPRCPASDLHLLQVSDCDSSRLSLDLNVYDAGLQVSDVLPLLAAVNEISGESVSALEAVASSSLGHVAAGLDGSGQPFYTVYYGAGERGGYQ